eukprot:TRINITY_DN17448_c0_g1_i3.p1 TRINITY_DN17448_c0_g1~~TRINITY_DN17448_c0_g1_i3.p1  ORF type:complete len:565 (-),score=78.13 TRINITY_DN17448_c0_g1_i3:46-1719(-)
MRSVVSFVGLTSTKSQRSRSTKAHCANPKLIFFDTTLRDGEQAPGCALTVEEKVTIAHQLANLGVDVCEAGFPIASEGDFEAVRRIALEVGHHTDGRTSGLPMRICGLARAREKDILRCFEAVKHAALPRIHTFLATSDIHLNHKLEITRRQCLQRIVAAVKLARSLVDDVQFSPEDALRTDLAFLVEVLNAAIEAGATTINIPDTVGVSLPDEYENTISYLLAKTTGAGSVTWSTHCHDDLGLATSNTLAGIRGGARQVEVTINGIGERAGNASLEEVAMAIKLHKSKFGLSDHLDRCQLFKTSQLVSAFTGSEVQRNKAVVGANAFAHGAGIHQHGMLKHRSTYEILNPEEVGMTKSELVLGKHSGISALENRLKGIGVELSREQLQGVFSRFKQLADVKKVIADDDIRSLVADEVHKLHEIYVVQRLSVGTTGDVASVTIELLDSTSGKLLHSTATATGPGNAIVAAVTQATHISAEVLEYHVKSVTAGSDAIAEARMYVKAGARQGDGDHKEDLPSYERPFVCGYGVDTDVLRATAKAYVNAVNRIAYKKIND